MVFEFQCQGRSVSSPFGAGSERGEQIRVHDFAQQRVEVEWSDVFTDGYPLDDLRDEIHF